MIFEANTKILLNAVAKASQAAARKGIEILKHVLISADHDQVLVEATDFEVYYKITLPAKVKTPGAICPPGDRLSQVLKMQPGDTVHLEKKSNQSLVITSGKAKCKLSALASDEWPEWPAQPDIDAIRVSGEALAQALRVVMICVNKGDYSRYNLSGIYFEKINDSLRLTGTDSHRLATLDCKGWPGLKEFALSKGVIIPYRAVSLLHKAAATARDDEFSLKIGAEYLSMEHEDTVLLCRNNEGSYPDYGTIIPAQKSISCRVTLPRQDFYNAVSRVGVVATGEYKGISIEVSDSLMTLSSKSEVGQSVENLEVDNQGQAFSVGLNSEYLRDMCGVMQSEHITLQAENETSPWLVTGEGDPDYKQVIMPMRL